MINKEERLELYYSLIKGLDELSEVDKRLIKNSLRIRIELSDESDRGCVLLGSSYIENQLKILLEKILIGTKKHKKDLFSGYGPLSTFSSKIKLSYSLGIISENLYKELEIIKSIRNLFAHYPDKISFDNVEIIKLCNKLKLSYKIKKEESAKRLFLSSTSQVLGLLDIEYIKAKQFNEKKDELDNHFLEDKILEIKSFF
ncbi:MltR family transcriptional regulator [Tenuifilum osseticum]|uniref:MltR family transcriptional regulator n=1 Tax=Tenuifilum osseticum TaxID=3374723 RepID=UPI0034E57AAE